MWSMCYSNITLEYIQLNIKMQKKMLFAFWLRSDVETAKKKEGFFSLDF